MKKLLSLRVLLVAAMAISSPADVRAGAVPADPPDRSLVSILSIKNAKSGLEDILGLGDRITLEVSGNSNALQRATADWKKLVLVVNDTCLRMLCTNATMATNATGTNPGIARLQFLLERKEANKAEWTTLLGSPKRRVLPAKLEIGLEANNSVEILSQVSRPFTLVLLPNVPFLAKGGRKWNLSAFAIAVSVVALFISVIRTRRLSGLLEGWVWICWAILVIGIYLCFGQTWCWIVFAILFLVGFFYLATQTEMIRDSGQQPPKGKLRPYSLARTQMAVWFFLSISAFVFIWLMTNSLDTITATVLALMGIGAGTALGAEAQETSKVNKLKAEQQELEAKAQRSREEEIRLNKLQQMLLEIDVPALEAERRDLLHLSGKFARLEKIGQLLANLAKPESLEGPTAALKQARLKKASAEEIAQLEAALKALNEQLLERGKLEAEQQDLQAQLAGIPLPGARIRQIDELLASLPVSEGFFNDVLTDDVGISFHRFQMFVWTLVLGIIFIASVYHLLAMPEFNDTLLALMGISSGTYMGFMIAEPKK